MASSGWQGEQTWFTYSSNIRLVGNIYVSGITHSGTNLRIQGTISAGARGSNNYSFYYSDYTSYAQPESGGKIALGGKGKRWKVGESDTWVSFDVTLSNVPVTSTSRSFFVNFYGPNTNSVQATLRWNLSFDASMTAPTGPYINYTSSTYNSVQAVSGVSSWGGGSSTQMQAIIVVGSSYNDFNAITQENWYGKGRYVWTRATGNLSESFNMVVGEQSMTYNEPMALKGMIRYYLACWQTNSLGAGYTINTTLRYMPPAPCLLTYTEQSAGGGAKKYTFTFVGDTNANYADYNPSNLSRSVRYKVNNASNWTYAEQGVNKALDATTTFTVTVPAYGNVKVDGWMTYNGLDSEHKTMTVYNGSAPSSVYGSVDGKAKTIEKFYGSVGGQSVEIVKLYGSVDGESVKLLG